MKETRWLVLLLLCAAALALTGVAFAQTPASNNPAARATPTPKVYARLEADYTIYNWRKADAPDLTGTMKVYAHGGDGHYTYEMIGMRYTDTFDFRWRACHVLVNSLRVRSGDGQEISVPVWRKDLPCPEGWRGEEEEE